ncbi:type II toxin-antitoxin system VapC family toxin [Prosthecomicrobium sp. N25]|uniref:type II toxin-antitoxin system VapC family toxin n=1 Tax=Prosthecomicrobium sp. N25 TaxID=3129254 RepID=UPI003076BEF8
MNAIVLDTSAVLAIVFDEPGAAAVDAVLDDAVVCSVNQVEIVSKLVDRGLDEPAIQGRLAYLNYSVRGFDAELGFRAGLLRSTTRRQGLSLGDRACIALAQREGLPIMTADRAWGSLDLGVPIQVIR